MVVLRRAGIGSLGPLGQILLFISIVSVTLLTITWNELLSCRNASQQIAALRSEGLDPSTITQQNTVLRNMTQRIHTAEQALLRLLALPKRAASQNSKAASGDGTSAGEASTPDPTGVATNLAGQGAGGGGGAPGDGAAAAADDEEAKAQAEQERDEREQRILIQYDEGTKKFRRWRPDFKCGSRVPLLPDEEVVECDPRSETPCCSSLGWCGKTKLHCRCPTCLDYRQETRG
mmetsp:Transcript_133814/g.416204  ORF Transcript_133814/g.416204 Transcript_133814/m.416204 type:complete len:233 (-) Transcript_133814:310-1008(-)